MGNSSKSIYIFVRVNPHFSLKCIRTYPVLEVAHLLVVVAKVGEQEGLEERRHRLRSRHRSSRRSDHGHHERALRCVAPESLDGLGSLIFFFEKLY